MTGIFSSNLAGNRANSVNPQKVSDIAFHEIWLAIVEQDLKPGQTITEESLAESFEVSRTPLREAIQKLASLGLVVRHPNRSMSVATLNIQHILNLSNTRESLEGLIATNVLERFQAGEVTLDNVIAIHEKMKKLLIIEDDELLLDLGRRFHIEMEALCSNTVAISILDQILLAMEPYRRLILGQEKRFESIVAEHEVILACIEKGDKAALLGALNTHFANARANYDQHLRQLAAS